MYAWPTENHAGRIRLTGSGSGKINIYWTSVDKLFQWDACVKRAGIWYVKESKEIQAVLLPESLAEVLLIRLVSSGCSTVLLEVCTAPIALLGCSPNLKGKAKCQWTKVSIFKAGLRKMRPWPLVPVDHSPPLPFILSWCPPFVTQFAEHKNTF